MEPDRTRPCLRCGKVMINVGDGRLGEDRELVEAHYHCPTCHARATLFFEDGRVEPFISEEAMKFLTASEVLTELGTKGNKYPTSWIPVDNSH